MTRKAISRRNLTRQKWIDAALQLLSEAGIGAVSMERLAANLGVSRGSFYHHFADREDLLQALLDYWAKRWTYDVRDQLAVLGLEPRAMLLALIRTIRASGAAEYDAPFRAWALHDPLARAVVRDVDETRLGFIRSQFEALGFSGQEAENRARLLLHFEVALPAMFADLSPEQDEQLLPERLRFLTDAHVE